MYAFQLAGDPVRVVPYDLAWPELFARQARDLRDALCLAPQMLNSTNLG